MEGKHELGKDKVNLRILKTRKAIKEAFLRLVQTKGYERITVQDIAKEDDDKSQHILFALCR